MVTHLFKVVALLSACLGIVGCDVVTAVIMLGAEYEDDFIFNPTANTASQTKVGGLLDIDSDGYYDYNDSGEEMLYGQFDNDSGISGAGYDGNDEIDDINGSNSTSLNTFTAKHAHGMKYYSSLSSNGIQTAHYE